MTDIFRLADNFGPTRVIHVHQPTLGLKGIHVVDNIATGPFIGGLRMAPDVSVEERERWAAQGRQLRQKEVPLYLLPVGRH